MHPSFTLEEAFQRARHARLNRRALIMLLQDQGSYWWGGHIDKWHPQPTVFPSLAAAEQCRQLIDRFRHGRTNKGHMLLIHHDGAIAAVLLGIESQDEAQQWLDDTVLACGGRAAAIPAAAMTVRAACL